MPPTSDACCLNVSSLSGTRAALNHFYAPPTGGSVEAISVWIEPVAIGGARFSLEIWEGMSFGNGGGCPPVYAKTIAAQHQPSAGLTKVTIPTIASSRIPLTPNYPYFVVINADHPTPPPSGYPVSRVGMYSQPYTSIGTHYTTSLPLSSGVGGVNNCNGWSGCLVQANCTPCMAYGVQIGFGQPPTLRAWVDPLYSAALTDWPATSTTPRSSKYVFGNDDYVFVSLTNHDLNSATVEYRAVRVTSQVDSVTGVIVTLKETSASSGEFRTVEQLHFDRTTVDAGGEGAVSHLRVSGEELIRFRSIELPSLTMTAEVDYAEYGVEWQADYGPPNHNCGGLSKLRCADDASVAFATRLDQRRPGWDRLFLNYDLASMKASWADSSAPELADSADLAWWLGHGPRGPLGPSLSFFVTTCPNDELQHSEVTWGNSDLEYVLLETCSFLWTDRTLPFEVQVAQLKELSGGAHLVLGYPEVMIEYCALGDSLGTRLDTGTLKEIWFEHVEEMQVQGTTARVFGAVHCMDDRLPARPSESTPSGWQTPDPGPDSPYTFEDYVRIPDGP